MIISPARFRRCPSSRRGVPCACTLHVHGPRLPARRRKAGAAQGVDRSSGMDFSAPPPEPRRREDVDHQREPCPHRIIDDVGGAYSMGAIGGSIWHGVKGARNSPRGARLLGAVDAVKLRAPRLGGAFAVWGGLFSTFDCTLQAIRGKEDPVNAIASGAITGGVLAIRSGPRAAGKSALVGGVLLALIEGVGIMLTRALSNQTPSPEEIEAMRAEMQAAREKGVDVPDLAGLDPSGQVPNFWSAGTDASGDGLAGVGHWAPGSGASA